MEPLHENSSKSEMNASSLTGQLFSSTQIWRYLALGCAIAVFVLSIMGAVGNVLSICVFSQSHFRRVSINILLLALSIADLTMLLLAFPVTFCSPVIGFAPHWRAVQPVYAVAVTSVFPVACMAQCASIWLLVTVTAERWAAVCRPFQVNRLFTRERAVVFIVIISIYSTCYNLVRFWDFRLEDGFELNVTSLRVNKHYVLWKVTVADLTFMYFIPLLILLVLNTRVVVKIHKSQSLRKISLAQRGERRTARMLVYVVIMFITCYTPALILNLIEVMRPTLFDSRFGYFASDLNNILAAVNSATTWLFYLKFSSRYRDTAVYLIKWILCQKVDPKPRMRARHSITGTSTFLIQQNMEQRFQMSRPKTVRAGAMAKRLEGIQPVKRMSSNPDLQPRRVIVKISDNALRAESSSTLGKQCYL